MRETLWMMNMDPIHQSQLTNSTVLMIVDGCFVYFIRLNSVYPHIRSSSTLPFLLTRTGWGLQ